MSAVHVSVGVSALVGPSRTAAAQVPVMRARVMRYRRAGRSAPVVPRRSIAEGPIPSPLLLEVTLDTIRTTDYPPATKVPALPDPGRSRRSLLAAAAGAAAALVGRSLADPDPVAAASVVLGGVNTTNAATTIRTTQASASAKAVVGKVLTAIAGPNSAGVQGSSNAQGGIGVFGIASNGASRGVLGRSAAGTGVHGEATATTGANQGVRGVSPSTAGVGVQGIASATSGDTIGVLGDVASPTGMGVRGQNTGTNGTGVFGVANTGGLAKGVWGRSTGGTGVRAEGRVGVDGFGDPGVQGTGNPGVKGLAFDHGVFGDSTGGNGVYGRTNARGAAGMYGESTYAADIANVSYGVAGRGFYGLWGSRPGHLRGRRLRRSWRRTLEVRSVRARSHRRRHGRLLRGQRARHGHIHQSGDGARVGPSRCAR